MNKWHGILTHGTMSDRTEYAEAHIVTVIVEENGGQCLADNIEASEPGNAQRLSKATKGLYKFVPMTKTWFVYEAGRWVEDAGDILLTGLAKKVPQSMYEMARVAMEGIGPCPDGTTKKVDGRKAKTAEIEEQQAKFEEEQTAQERWMAKAAPFLAMKTWADKSNNESQLRHMISLVKDLPGISIDYDTMDNRPHLINFLNGTYDAELDLFRPADPADLLIKQCTVNFNPNATCPLWDRCTQTWQPNRDNLAFLQRIIGSACIGEAVQNLFANIGLGANGKDSFFTPIQGILGDYAGVAPEDMIVDTSSPAHDEDWARLKGKRFVLFPETNRGAKLHTSRLKNITGGGRIRARHLWGKPFDFLPGYTAFMHSNHGLRITETDNGIWRRYIEIPWDHIVPVAEMDLQLGDKLKGEYEGIAQWMIEGVRQWRKRGLDTPDAIRDRTEEVRQAQDLIGLFIEDCWEAMVSSEGYVKSDDLRRRYAAWCETEGLKPWVQHTVGKSLTERGFERKRRRVGAWTGWCWSAPKVNNPDSLTSTVTLVHLDTTSVHMEEKNRNGMGKLEGEIEGMGEVVHKDHTPGPSVDPEVTSEEIPESTWFKEYNRRYLTEHGFPVPPTDDELEAMEAQRAEDMEERERQHEPTEQEIEAQQRRREEDIRDRENTPPWEVDNAVRSS